MKKAKCVFCGGEYSRSAMKRHQETCHMQPGREPKPLHFTDLQSSPFTIKSPYGKPR